MAWLLKNREGICPGYIPNECTIDFFAFSDEKSFCMLVVPTNFIALMMGGTAIWITPATSSEGYFQVEPAMASSLPGYFLVFLNLGRWKLS